MRERLGWGPVETERDKFTWVQDYDEPADVFSAEGVRVCSAWHDSPAWTHPDNSQATCPDDLRDVYGFAKAEASHNASKMQAFEVWNEPDGGWFKELGDKYAGFMKASYLGFKDGNRNSLVLTGSICAGETPFLRNIYDSGIIDYYDVFNWHCYTTAPGFKNILGRHMEVLQQYGMYKRPVWMTEAGIGTGECEGEGKLLLSARDQHSQCQYVPQAVASSFAAGTDRFFYFVLPSCKEGNIQWGVLRPDITPNASFVALSAASHIIGRSKYVGEYKSAGVTAHCLATPRGNVLVMWADKDTEVAVPTEKSAVTMANIFGDERQVSAINGTARVKVGPDAIYLINVGKKMQAQLIKPVIPRLKMGANKPSRIVVVGHCKLPAVWEKSAYNFSIDKSSGKASSFDYTVDVYNFNKGKSETGLVELACPASWRVENPKRTVTVGPMGREILSYKVTPTVSPEYPMKVVARSKFKNERVQPAVSYFTTDPGDLKPIKSKPLDWTNAADWIPSAGCGSVAVTNPEPGTMRVECRFNQPGDRWAYPNLSVKMPSDVANYDGIAFDLKTFNADPGTRINMMLVESEAGGKLTPNYMSGTNPDGSKRRVLFLFKDMRWLFFVGGPDPTFGLDPRNVSIVKLGCNTSLDQVTFEASNFELVKFKH